MRPRVWPMQPKERPTVLEIAVCPRCESGVFVTNHTGWLACPTCKCDTAFRPGYGDIWWPTDVKGFGGGRSPFLSSEGT